jgi:hypothetical protein
MLDAAAGATHISRTTGHLLHAGVPPHSCAEHACPPPPAAPSPLPIGDGPSRPTDCSTRTVSTLQGTAPSQAQAAKAPQSITTPPRSSHNKAPSILTCSRPYGAPVRTVRGASTPKAAARQRAHVGRARAPVCPHHRHESPFKALPRSRAAPIPPLVGMPGAPPPLGLGGGTPFGPVRGVGRRGASQGGVA